MAGNNTCILLNSSIQNQMSWKIFYFKKIYFKLDKETLVGIHLER